MSAQPNQANLTSLFVGNLDTRVYRELLIEIFSLAGRITQCHVVYDKTTGLSSGFGFVQYEDHKTAESAMEKFRGRSIYGKLLTIDWARATTRDPAAGPKTDEPASQFCLFVGNLSPDVTDEQLVTAFSEFGSCASAKCAKDPVTQKTQGFAFVSFRERAHAVTAMDAMNGQLLNNRPLRVDWAKGKTGGGKNTSTDEPVAIDTKKEPLNFEAVLAQTSVNNVTAYVSGLPSSTNEEGIRDVFSHFGAIREIRIPESAKSATSDTIYAFVRYMDHASAAKAIFECQAGTSVDGKNVNVHWGRETVRRTPPGMYRPLLAHPPYYHSGFHQQPQSHHQQHQQLPQHPQQHSQPHPQSHPHPQQQPPAQYPPTYPYIPQQHAAHPMRPVYPNQPYARGAPPGPVHQPHATAQHRYRPY